MAETAMAALPRGAREARREAAGRADGDEAIADALHKKLQRWIGMGSAPEYFALRNRGPSRPTVSHELNRFGGNMGPYVDAQLKLKSVEYINASAIDNVNADAPPFVATMCPKCSTFSHFWSMVWEMGATTIVNLTNENDRVGSGPNDKRERYWPPFDNRETHRLAASWPVEPRLLGVDQCKHIDALQRFAIELLGPRPSGGGDRPRRVLALYWYARWEDFPDSSYIGTPSFYANAWHVLKLALHVASELQLKGQRTPSERWGVCHCSAGVGRTGAFIGLVHMLLKLPALSSVRAIDEAMVRCLPATQQPPVPSWPSHRAQALFSNLNPDSPPSFRRS